MNPADLLPPPLAAVVDDRVGIVSRLHVVPVYQRCPRIWIVIAEPADSRRLGATWRPEQGSGAGLDLATAAAAAVGEVVERYSAGFVPSNLISGTPRHLSHEYALPDVVSLNNLHAPNEPGFDQVEEDVSGRWAIGTWAHDPAVPTLAPWSLVHMAATVSTRRDEDGWYPGPSVSTGLAAGSTTEAAVRGAILEICERDAVMLAWRTRVARARWSSRLVAQRWPQIADDLVRCGVNLELLDVTNDLDVPTFIGVTHRRDDATAASFGMAADLSYTGAAEKAITESLATWAWSESMKLTGEPIVRYAAHGFFTDFPSRVAAYGSGAMRDELKRFFRDVDDLADVADIDSVSTSVRTTGEVIDTMLERGHKVQLFDITQTDIADAGLSTFRALCSTLQPMESSEAGRNISARLALADRKGTLCLDPHPFP